MTKEEFKPNDIKQEDIDSLEDWQLLVAACHFGPSMGDCVDLDYSYTIEDGVLYCGTVSLAGDIDMDEPVKALEQYAGYPEWQEQAKTLLGKVIE